MERFDYDWSELWDEFDPKKAKKLTESVNKKKLNEGAADLSEIKRIVDSVLDEGCGKSCKNVNEELSGCHEDRLFLQSEDGVNYFDDDGNAYGLAGNELHDLLSDKVYGSADWYFADMDGDPATDDSFEYIVLTRTVCDEDPDEIDYEAADELEYAPVPEFEEGLNECGMLEMNEAEECEEGGCCLSKDECKKYGIALYSYLRKNPDKELKQLCDMLIKYCN